MRTEDSRYLQLLECLRHGQCNYDDYELLLTRVVGQPSVGSLCDSPWNKAPILVFRNEVRTQLDNKAAIHNATQLGYVPIKTGHLPGLLPFVPGMPVILTQNIPIELGLINGINGIFRQLVYQADSVSTDVLSEIFPKNTQYIHRPLYALIEIVKSKTESNLEKLQPKLVPIPAPILVFRNEIQTQLNNKAAIHNAAQLGHVPMVCVAQDTCNGKPIKDPILIKKLLELSDNKTEHLSGLLPFVPGMPVILTQNIAIELGFINGINGIFRQLVYQADSVSTDVLSEIFPKNTQYIHRPLYALMEIAKSKIESNLEELQPKLVPIPVIEHTFRVNISDSLPKDKKPKSN
ncbi:unnamed protein product [Rotaria sordida]|uniref:Uncharacterized protein n=2 Tax=Rotaria sordida TaxID=392033 RepID=A0A815JWC9_9BILA|nr:unnamed protein product [Rotaria sordida]